jgi:hypothetical protein
MQQESERGRLAKAIVITAEVMGHEISPNAAAAMASALAEYEPQDALAALRKCQREITGKLSLAAVIARIDDGHPGAEDAWALCPRLVRDSWGHQRVDQDATIVWTDEIRRAFSAAESVLESGDATAARMTFREVYTRELQLARNARRKAQWEVCAGQDPRGRDQPIREAVELGRLPERCLELHAPNIERPARRLANGETMSLASMAEAIKTLPMMRKDPDEDE